MSSRVSLPSAQPLCQQPLHSSDSSLSSSHFVSAPWHPPAREAGKLPVGVGGLEPLLRWGDHCSVTSHQAPSHACPSAPGLVPESGAAPPCSHPPGLAQGQPDAHCSPPCPSLGEGRSAFLWAQCASHPHSSVTGALPEPQGSIGWTHHPTSSWRQQSQHVRCSLVRAPGAGSGLRSPWTR